MLFNVLKAGEPKIRRTEGMVLVRHREMAPLARIDFQD
jgi:hypothetical protein